jgi:hypothetical protein
MILTGLVRPRRVRLLQDLDSVAGDGGGAIGRGEDGADDADPDADSDAGADRRWGV